MYIYVHMYMRDMQLGRATCVHAARFKLKEQASTAHCSHSKRMPRVSDLIFKEKSGRVSPTSLRGTAGSTVSNRAL